MPSNCYAGSANGEWRIACSENPTNGDLQYLPMYAIGSITILPLERPTVVKKHAISRWMLVFVYLNEMACSDTISPHTGLCLYPVSRRIVTRFSNSWTPHITTTIEKGQQGRYGISSIVTAFAPCD